MSIVIYSDAEIEKVKGITYRKLNEYFGVIAGATSVYVDGDTEAAAAIKTAYEAKGVTILDELPTNPNPPTPNNPVSWADITDKPELLGLGTTATTAAAGNHNHAITANAASGLAAAANLQAGFVALSTRIKTLEDAAG